MPFIITQRNRMSSLQFLNCQPRHLGDHGSNCLPPHPARQAGRKGSLRNTDAALDIQESAFSRSVRGLEEPSAFASLYELLCIAGNGNSTT